VLALGWKTDLDQAFCLFRGRTWRTRSEKHQDARNRLVHWASNNQVGWRYLFCTGMGLSVAWAWRRRERLVMLVFGTAESGQQRL
jgi:hypothetical protein